MALADARENKLAIAVATLDRIFRDTALIVGLLAQGAPFLVANADMHRIVPQDPIRADGYAETLRSVVMPLTDWPATTIARHLNEHRIPTPRGGKWHHETVRRLLKRLHLNAPEHLGIRRRRGGIAVRSSTEAIRSGMVALNGFARAKDAEGFSAPDRTDDSDRSDIRREAIGCA